MSRAMPDRFNSTSAPSFSTSAPSFSTSAPSFIVTTVSGDLRRAQEVLDQHGSAAADFSALVTALTEARAESAALAAECVEIRRNLRRQVVTERARRRNAEQRLAAVREVVRKARQISPSPSMHVYVADLERALGVDAPVPHKLGGNDGSDP